MAVNPNPSQLDADQIIKREFDDSNDAMRVNVVSGSFSVNVDSELVDNSAFTPNTDSTIIIGAEVDEVAPSTVSEGNGGALRMSPERSLYTELRDAAGNNRGANVTASNELSVLATAQPGVDIGDVTVNNGSGASAVNIQDGGNSITVDGSLSVSATNLDIRDLTSVSDSVSVLQSSADNLNANANLQVADVDVSNGNPVPVSDAGGSLTVDGSVTASQATHDSLNANATLQVADVDVSNANPVPVSDAGSSLTVDANNLDIRDLTSVSDSVSSVQSGNWSTRIQDSSGNSLNSTTNALHVNVQNASLAVTQSGNFTVRTQDGSGNALTSTANALDVNLKTSSITLNTAEAAYTLSEFVRNDYSSVNVTTGAYVQLIASTANTYKELHVFDSSGQTLKLATGGSGSEVDKVIIPPGGTFPVRLSIASGTRISIRAISGTASTGEIDIQFLG